MLKFAPPLVPRTHAEPPFAQRVNSMENQETLLRRNQTAIVLVLLTCILSSGCAEWSNQHTNDSVVSLPKLAQSPDSVTIETVFVRFPLEQAAALTDIWSNVDESVLDIELRRRLDKNGLRAGILLGKLPTSIHQQLVQTSVKQTSDALEHAGLAADVDNRMRQLHCRAGRRKDLIVRREVVEPLTVLTTLDGHISGETFLRPTALFDLRVVPHANGQATIELTPEIQHGDHVQSYVSTEFGVRPELRRQQAVWKELSVRIRLSPGQVMMVSSTTPSKALGKALFMTQTADQTEEHVMLLVRLAATQMDELFAPETIEQAHILTER
ncbi:MAG: hypothetical protein R3C53_17090 [Pirellulaceae bacterium]